MVTAFCGCQPYFPSSHSVRVLFLSSSSLCLLGSLLFGLFGRVVLRLGVVIWFIGLFRGVLTVFRVSVAPCVFLWAIDSSLV